MSERTGVSWADHTFNIAWGCEKISPGCANCYADTFARRTGRDVWGKGKPRRTFGEKHWREPLAWDQKAFAAGVRRRVFCSSMTDWTLDDPTVIAEAAKLFPLIRATPNLDWLLLTKRDDRIRSTLPADWGAGYANVWLGVSVENADYEFRIATLRGIPATVRFVSYEPALGPLSNDLDLSGIDWLIYGGESGPGFRPDVDEWSRRARRLCERQGTTFFRKQGSNLYPGRRVDLDGEIVQAIPAGRRVPLSVLAG